VTTRARVLLQGYPSEAAGALSLGFFAFSVDPTTPTSKVFGYLDAGGFSHATPFRQDDCVRVGTLPLEVPTSTPAASSFSTSRSPGPTPPPPTATPPWSAPGERGGR